MPAVDKVFLLIESTVRKYAESPSARNAAIEKGNDLPIAQKCNIDAILSLSKGVSYRDGVILQLAYGLCGSQDLTRRRRGARTVAQRLGQLFSDIHIKSVKDAYQNIAKNTPDLVRGNFLQFDDFLQWIAALSETSKVEHRKLLNDSFDYTCASVAATARPVEQFPELEQGKLTFSAVLGLLEDLLSKRSQGSYEQFTVAALLHAFIELAPATGYRVETKSINASDKSSRSAGDIQILAGNRVIEAFEVTAGDWQEKFAGAPRVIREHDLGRLHIVAPIECHEKVLPALSEAIDDVSVLELHSFVATLVSSLTKPKRYVALERLYQLLERCQPDIDRVNRYVRLLKKRSLASAR